MLPVLLDLKVIKIYTFGVFMVLGFFWGLFLVWKMIKLTAHKEEDIFDGIFIVLLGGLFTGRLLYVLLNFSRFGLNVLKFILVNGYPGFSLYGGLVGGFFFFFLFLRSKKIPFLTIIDYQMPGLFMALAFGKMGAFLSGDGQAEIYEGLLFLLGAYLAHKILLAVRRERVSSGFAWYFFGWYLATVYALLDNLKTDHLYFLRLNFNLTLSVFISTLFSLYFIIFFRKEWFAISKYVISTVKITTRRLKKNAHQRRGGDQRPH